MPRRLTPRLRAILALVVIAITMAIWIPAQSASLFAESDVTPEPISTEQIESAVTPDPTVEAVVTEEVIIQPTATDVPPTLAPVEPTAVPAEPEVTPEPTAPTDKEDTADPNLPQTFCRMSVDDLGDNNPFTYQFSAVDANNMASFAWNFGDTNTATTQVATHTYTATGTFNVALTCTPNVGFGSPIILTGTITINTSPVADFTLTPGNSFVGIPKTVSTVNTSTGGGLTYAWKISTSNNPNDPGIYTATTPNISYEFTATEVTSYPAIFYFHLFATDGAGSVAYAMDSIVFNAPAPKADFTLSPSTGAAPLSITVNGVDLLEGPITNWSWDFNGDGIEDANGQGPHNYVYATNGIYNVRLDYTGPGGAGWIQKSVGVFPASDPVLAQFTYQMTGNPVAGIEVCFTNNSTGPVVSSQWDFNGDGIYDLTSNDKVVCHVYATAATYLVRLRVSDGGSPAVTSTSSQNVTVVAEPVASFNVTPGENITQGTSVTLTDTSTGAITQWRWDFNGDGVTDSTAQNPNNVNTFLQLGANPIRLTVEGPGGTSFAEKIIFVARLEITCDFTGTLNVLPGTGSVTYTSSIGNQLSRPISYTWTVTGTGTGLPLTVSSQNLNVNWGSIGYGTFQVTLQASTSDGSTCSESKTVTHVWNPLNCQISTTLPATLYADGNTYNFTANVSNINGRALIAYEWYVDDVLQYAGPSNTFNWTNTTNTASLPLPVKVHYIIYVDNGVGFTPTTSSCSEARNFTVQPWPVLACTNITGNVSPVPVNATTGALVSYNYTAVVTGDAGRTLTFTWAVSDGTITSTNPRTGTNTNPTNQVTVRWNTTAGSLPPVSANDSIQVTVTANNPDGTTVNCNFTRSIGVTYNNLVCNLPVGDNTPVVGEINNYVKNITNIYGRSYTILWELEQLTPVANTSTGSTEPFTFTFPTPGATYRLRYTITASANGSIPADACTSAWLNITVYGDGVGFECESVNLTGNATPTNPAGSFSYSIDVDNGNLYQLRYTWILRNRDGTDFTLAGPINSNTDGIITSPAFTLAQLAPAPYFADTNYTLRVEVAAVNPLDTTHTCSRNIALNVGTVTATYNYTVGTWTNTALPVGQPICLTNTSVMNPGTINDMTYTWTVSGSAANNSWATNTRTDQQPADCISFNAPGTYTIALQASNIAGSKTNTYSQVFTVYGLQGILANRTTNNFVTTPQNFTATGTNITGGWNWQFIRLSDNVVVATRSVQNPSNVTFATPGAYRAIVSGNGPLGTTTAQLDFNLIASGGLTAAFRASQYGGLAPMNVCFTDQSITGSPITLWEWDFDGDGTFDLTYSVPPANVCHNYTVGGQVYPVSLRVTNSGGFVDTATNNIRTYSLLESSANFSISPAGTGRFCFTPQITGSVIVTGWDFGDGNTGPGGPGTICHTYGASGSYQVYMHISDGTTTGTIVRTVVVNLTSGTPPSLAASASCAPNTTAIFTITNTGGAMTTPDQVIIYNQDGDAILIAPLQLGAAPASTTFTVTGVLGALTLITTDTAITANTYCAQPPQLAISHACQPDGSVIFTINNTGTETAANQPYEIRNAANVLVTSGTLNVAINGSTNITVNGPASWGQLTFSSSGIQGPSTVLADSSDCDTPPLLNASHVCQPNGTVIFTITNTSTETPANQAYEVRNASNVLITSGTLNIPTGGSTTVTVSPPDSWGSLTLTSNGGALGSTTVISNTSDCTTPPQLTSLAACQPDGSVIFTINNNLPAEVGANQLYEIRDASNNVIASGTLTIAVGASQTVIVNPTASYGQVTFSTTGGTQGATTVVVETTDCLAPPQLAISHACQPDGSVIFTINNNAPAETAANQPFTIIDATNTQITSGTLSIPVGASQTVTVNPTASYGQLTFISSGGVLGSTTVISYNNSDCDAPPQLAISHACQPDGSVLFTINNNAPAQVAANQPYEIRNAANSIVDSGTLSIAVGASQTVTVNPTASYNQLTFSSSGGSLGSTTVISNTSDCDAPPQLTISHACQADGSVTFTINNNAPAQVAANQPYEIRDAANTLITSGTLSIAVGASQTVTVNPNASYNTLTFTSNGGALGSTTVISDTSDCDAPPQLSISHACAADGSVTFTINNNAPAQVAANQPYEVRDSANALITSGTLSIAVGASQTVTVNPTASYGQLTFTSSSATQGSTTVISDSSNCDAPPQLSISNVCQLDGTVIFTVTNSAPAELAANQPYQIVDATNTAINTGTLSIAIGASQDITIPGPNSYGQLTFTSDGGALGSTTVISDTSNCNEPPILSAAGACQIDGTAVFTISNASTESAASQPYTITNLSGTVVQSGTLTVAIGGSSVITVTNIYGQLTLTSSGVEGITTSITTSTNCAEPPKLSGMAMCTDGTAIFQVRNTSADTAANQPYNISDGNNVSVSTGTLNIPTGSTQTIIIEDQEGNLTFKTTGAQGITTNMTLSTTCNRVDVRLSATSVCTPEGSIEFTVRNNSSSVISQPYSIVSQKTLISIQTGTLTIDPQMTQTITIPGSSGTVNLITEGNRSSINMTAACSTQISDETVDVDTDHLPNPSRRPNQPDTTTVNAPAWEDLGVGAVGEAVCPDWMVYHTNMTGDWEIFRLGDGEGGRLAQYDPNLSQGRGAGVIDMAPTRSPDGDWIAFTSNRDSTDIENWELYVSKVDNSIIRRVTYNTFAFDIDPAWSPDGRYLVFETDRDGNWELYLFDLSTGAETRLTDVAANDINAFWTPDSKQIIFQSDRDGMWQIYSMDVATREITRLSDGTTQDSDPSVSFDGKMIAFRAYASNGGVSSIYTMNIDGSDKQLVSNPAASATNHTWSPDDKLIAYQSALDGDLDIYVYELETKQTRLVTDNEIPDYAPTWWCDSPVVVFTSDVLGDANIFNTPALPIDADAILVDETASQMTFDPKQDVYPENTPSEENASREGDVPPMIGASTADNF